ncbi:hypothetical protein Dimus_001848, partial [Dionaea muscipula]
MSLVAVDHGSGELKEFMATVGELRKCIPRNLAGHDTRSWGIAGVCRLESQSPRLGDVMSYHVSRVCSQLRLGGVPSLLGSEYFSSLT